MPDLAILTHMGLPVNIARLDFGVRAVVGVHSIETVISDTTTLGNGHKNLITNDKWWNLTLNHSSYKILAPTLAIKRKKRLPVMIV